MSKTVTKRARGDNGGPVAVAQQSSVEPRVALWRATIILAWADFFGVVSGEDDAKPTLKAKEEAGRFLLDPEESEWGQSRVQIADLIGENSESLRLETLRTIKFFEDMIIDIGKLAHAAALRREARRAKDAARRIAKQAAQFPLKTAAE